MKTIYLFRHGEVEDAYRDRVRGSGTDCVLSPEGEKMSIANVQFLIKAGIRVVITTGMKRTDYVGELLSKKHGIAHRVEPRLKEMHLGKWEGQLLADVNAAHPEEAKKFIADPLSGVFPDVEDASKYRERILSAWNDILRHDEEKAAVVAHGITNTVILGAVSGQPHPLKQIIGCMNEIAVGPPSSLVQTNVVLYAGEGAR
jgi:broad specificity phosphatase PhoE